MTNQRFITILGWIATFTAVCMFVSYIEQINMNLNGMKGSTLQPLATAVNCSLWVAYGLLKKERDYPVAIANSPGVILGLICFVTAL
ncbi:SemiSWEET family transporter [Aggregatibacter aphrophilus]|uniref:SemiSWEET family transporter n=1 Tax=Aggregatibacter aphrophilus TaxID=732 RepID=UPI000D65DB07|nr:SemiSWEET family transporter [Aggregatibacter aphrophilus]